MLCLHNGTKHCSSVNRNSGHHWSEGCSKRNQSKSCVLYESIYVKYPEKNTESGSVIAQAWSWKRDGRQANMKGLLRLTETFCVLTGWDDDRTQHTKIEKTMNSLKRHQNGCLVMIPWCFREGRGSSSGFLLFQNYRLGVMTLALYREARMRWVCKKWVPARKHSLTGMYFLCFSCRKELKVWKGHHLAF